MTPARALAVLWLLFAAASPARAEDDAWALDDAVQGWRYQAHQQVLLYVASQLPDDQRPDASTQRRLLRSGLSVELVAALAGVDERSVQALEPARLPYRGIEQQTTRPSAALRTVEERAVWTAIDRALAGEMGEGAGWTRWSPLEAGPLQGRARWRIDDAGFALVALEVENTSDAAKRLIVSLDGGVAVRARDVAARVVGTSASAVRWHQRPSSYASRMDMRGYAQPLRWGSVYEQALAPDGAVYQENTWGPPYRFARSQYRARTPLEQVVDAAAGAERARADASCLYGQISLAPGERTARVAAFYLDGSAEQLALAARAAEDQGSMALGWTASLPMGDSTVAPWTWDLAIERIPALPASIQAFLEARQPARANPIAARRAARAVRRDLAEARSYASAREMVGLLEDARAGAVAWTAWRPFDARRCEGRVRWAADARGVAIEAEVQNALDDAAVPFYVGADGGTRSSDRESMRYSYEKLYAAQRSALLRLIPERSAYREPQPARRISAARSALIRGYDQTLDERERALEADVMPRMATLPAGASRRWLKLAGRSHRATEDVVRPQRIVVTCDPRVGGYDTQWVEISTRGWD